MEEIKINVKVKELNGGTSSSEVTFSPLNEVTAEDHETGPTVEVSDIDSTGAAAGQVPIADGAGATAWGTIDLTPYATKSEMKGYAKDIVYSVSDQNVLTLQLRDGNGNALGTLVTLDLSDISPIVDGYWDEDTQSIVFELNNGNTITVPLSGVISGFLAMSVVDEAFTPITIQEG